MKAKQTRIPFFLIFCLCTSLFSDAKTSKNLPDPTDAKAVITNYINAIGGMDAIKALSSLKDTGTFSVQGNELPMVQKAKAPNKMLQVVAMNGTTVSKVIFNGTKGYTEQMGTHTEMPEADLADQKSHTSLIPQVDYLAGSTFKIALQGTEKVGETEAYKVQVTTPSGAVSTEYYDKTTNLLLKQVLTKEISGQSVTITYSFSDYRKAGNLLMPYKESLSIASGAINQSFDINISDIKVNEGVTGADFE